MGQGIIRINLDRPLEKLNRLLVIFLLVSVVVFASFDVVLIRPDIFSRFLLDALFFSRGERRLEGCGNLLGDIALDGKDFFPVPVEGIRPDIFIRCGVDQTGRNVHFSLSALYASNENMGNIELPADLFYSQAALFIPHRRGL